MNIKYFSIGSLILGTCLVTVSLKNSIGNMNDLIPREVLFGNPEKATARISPDGTLISYLASGQTPGTKNVLNIWVMPVEGGDARQVTFDEAKGIYQYYWHYNSERIFYSQDRDGDENWQIFDVSLSDLSTKEYTPEGSYAFVVAYSKFHPDRMLVALNEDNPSFYDVFELDLKSGDRKLIAKNDETIERWYADDDLRVRSALAIRDGGMVLLIDEDGEWQPHLEWTYDEYQSFGCFGFNRAGTVLYLRDSLDNDTGQLIEYNIKERSRRALFTCPTHDLSDGFIYNSDTDTLQAVAVEKERLHWHIFDPSCEKVFATLKKTHHGDPHIVSRSLDRTKWVVAYQSDTAPTQYYLYNTAKDTARFLFSTQPALDKYTLAPMKPVSLQSRDGLELHGYLTIPVDKKPENLPLILVVHGGPTVRDSWGFRSGVQWFANRGYAVLQVNYRGSTGYGKKFMVAAKRERGRKMHYDLLDAVQWAIDEKIADPKRVAIYGASFGGYAALCGATMSPEWFTCAIDLFGVSNLVSYMETIPAYWELGRPWMYEMYGHPEHDKELLIERSPLTHVDNISCPVLIAQGANDARIKQSESEQIVAAMKEKGIPHEYLLFENEGHGFRRPENKMIFYAAAEKFLAAHLGGLCQE